MSDEVEAVFTGAFGGEEGLVGLGEEISDGGVLEGELGMLFEAMGRVVGRVMRKQLDTTCSFPACPTRWFTTSQKR